MTNTIYKQSEQMTDKNGLKQKQRIFFSTVCKISVNKRYRYKNYILTHSLSLRSGDNNANANKATTNCFEFLSMACYNKIDFVTFTVKAQSGIRSAKLIILYVHFFMQRTRYSEPFRSADQPVGIVVYMCLHKRQYMENETRLLYVQDYFTRNTFHVSRYNKITTGQGTYMFHR